MVLAHGFPYHCRLPARCVVGLWADGGGPDFLARDQGAQMNPEDVKALVESGIEGARVTVQGSGDRFDIRVVSDAFEGQTPVRKQQLVYGCINDKIADGTIHAVNIQTYTEAEWEKAERMGLA
jgi:acid stress-induced BolA-like protein IbaG/YrbA